MNSSIEEISRVGASTAKRLRDLGVQTVEDLLFYFPFRYDDFSRISKISDLQVGQSANVVGEVEIIQNKRSRRRRMQITEALVNDGSDTLKITWFNQPFIAKNLRVGDRVSLAGKIEEYGGLVMVSPVYEKISQTTFEKRASSAVHTQGLVPNYHLTKNISQKQLRFLIAWSIQAAGQIVDWLPEEIKRELKLVNLGQAIKKIHFPARQQDIVIAKQRLAFDELFLIQMQSQLIRQDLATLEAPLVEFKTKEVKEFVDSLPFKLTNAQRKAAWEVIQDMSRRKPMSRLVEGDVGSGKTVVALIAMLNAAFAGWQSVLMAPTEILAKQHFLNFKKLLEKHGVNIGIITSSEKNISNSQTANRKPQAKQKLKNQKLKTEEIIANSQIIIGTHALTQDNVNFNNLGLVVIDEQHRFGVAQRKSLLNKSGGKLIPHLLSMTATPIPRSLALAVYGDLDLSMIDEQPRGRKKIHTFIVPEIKREKSYEFIKRQITAGRQVFVICPLIDFSDRQGVKSAKQEYEKLNQEIFPDLNIGLLHGKMKSAEKERIMSEFVAKKIKILVSTSVVEVGVDVPNATVMMIEGADRFGLAQLHQFRGRVGRGIEQSYCFLFTESNLPRTIARLQALVDCQSGFQLAKMDLKFRGPGEFYGTAQKGFPELKIASLFDYQLMKLARGQAIKILSSDPGLDKHPKLKQKVKNWEENTHSPTFPN